MQHSNVDSGGLVVENEHNFVTPEAYETIFLSIFFESLTFLGRQTYRMHGRADRRIDFATEILCILDF